MAKYDVYVYCDQCGQPHSVHLTVTLEDEGLDKVRLSEAFAGKPVPGQIAFMQTNKYPCPHTKRNFPAADLANAFLYASA